MKGFYPSFSGQPRLSVPLILVWTLLCSVFLIVPHALAAKAFKVGIVDPQAVFEKSKAGQRALATLKEHRTVRQKLLASNEKELKKLEEELRNGTGLTETKKQAKQEHLRQKVQEYQRRGQEFQQELGQKQKDMVLEYMKKIESATKAIAEKHGFSLIMDKGSDATLKIVLYSRQGLDITNEVVKEFDRRFP